MVRTITIGVLGVQGAISEHVSAMENALKETSSLSGQVIVARNKDEIKNVDALVIPGGESTTISGVISKSGLYEVILSRIKDNSLPIMGTCAGCVLLSKEIVDDKKDVKLLHAMDMQVERNTFGRQKESFEKYINIKGFSKPYNAVFIRAPVIKKAWGECKTLAIVDKKIVMARQDKFLALSFHPELTRDLRVHKYFLDMI